VARVITGYMIGAGALLVLASGPATAQDAAPLTAPAAKPAAISTHSAALHRHLHHRTRHLHLQTQVPVPDAARPETDAAGTTPAPMPNEDIGPPRAPASTSPSLDPGSLHLHYPPLGDGYLPGSSPQDMANSQTPKVPGATYTVPLQPAPRQTLPPPGTGQ
jgi:hypothetical protein